MRYVEEFRANIDNLVTICTDEIDIDRLALKAKIEQSLVRLENETLIRRNGDDYFFLNNEERDIDREIKEVQIPLSDQSKKLGSIFFEDILGDLRRHRYPVNKKDFGFDRYCDEYKIGMALTSNELRVDIISQLFDTYDLYTSGQCIMKSADRALIKLPTNVAIERELRLFSRPPSTSNAKQTCLRRRLQRRFYMNG